LPDQVWEDVKWKKVKGEKGNAPSEEKHGASVKLYLNVWGSSEHNRLGWVLGGVGVFPRNNAGRLKKGPQLRPCNGHLESRLFNERVTGIGWGGEKGGKRLKTRIKWKTSQTALRNKFLKKSQRRTSWSSTPEKEGSGSRRRPEKGGGELGGGNDHLNKGWPTDIWSTDVPNKVVTLSRGKTSESQEKGIKRLGSKQR